MRENPHNDRFSDDIGKYFKRDTDGEIKGTRWFFDVCYNNLSNLFHLKIILIEEKALQLLKHSLSKIFNQGHQASFRV